MDTPRTAAPFEEDNFERIWKLNENLSDAVEKSLDEIIVGHAHRQPSKPAVHAWDGNLTYGELHELSERLAHHLSGLGVGPEVIVPLCFEKSMWTVVAVLAVLKAGGAFALLDTNLPKSRLESIIEQTQAKVVCSSTASRHLCSVPSVNVQIVGPETSKSWPRARGSLPSHSPSRPLYVPFTSGSTGRPKGIVLSHTAFSSALTYQVPYLGFTSESRTYDFASYSFDVAIHNVMTTLAVGACLCIPSDMDRKQNLNQSIKEMRATIVNLTATVARLLRPELVPELKTLLLLGEAVSLIDIQGLWGGTLKVINTYGPAECTPISTINLTANTPEEAIGIGEGVGVLTWIVDPADHNKLMPFGESGELLLEGPVLARGYLHEPEKTAAAFIEDPAWLLEGPPDGTGRRGRLYKTGDLAKYNDDGTLGFIGRKDTQVKIRGQRMELGEVEHHVRKCVSSADQVVAEVIYPDGQKDKALLAAFMTLPAENSETVFSSATEISPGLELVRPSSAIADALAQRLPTYMIPSVWFRMAALPQTPSGKTDRKTIRETGSGLSSRQLAAVQTATDGDKRQPQTETEKQLRDLWSEVLNLAPQSIGLDDNFFLLGGDSVVAMRLVADARKAEVALSVTDIFKYPLLVEQAKVLTSQNTAEPENLTPFCLLTDAEDVQELCKDLSALCNIEAALVEDAYPSTPLQEGLLSMTASGSDNYTLQAVLELTSSLDVATFQAAWQKAVDSLPILRTRLVYYRRMGLVQVVCKEPIRWRHSKDLADYQKRDKAQKMKTGDALTRFALVEAANGKASYFVWTIHHSLYDGWSVPIILQLVGDIYRTLRSGATPTGIDRTNFNVFVKHLVQSTTPEAEAYWGSYLADGELTSFPALPQSVSQPSPNSTIERSLSVTSKTDITMSTLLRGALGVLIARYTGSTDAVFGATVSGRNAPVAGIEEIIGPTIATVPIRSQVQKEQSISDFLKAMQKQAAEMITHEQVGLQKIAKISPDCRLACGFQTLLVVQPEENELIDDADIGAWQQSSTRETTTYAVTLECFLRSDGVSVRAGFDTNIISEWRMERLLDHLTAILEQLASAQPGQTINDINAVTAQDVQTMWNWNLSMPDVIDKCVHDLIHTQFEARPESPAVCGWDAEFTYNELNDLSSRLAGHLTLLGVKPESIVPICFEKSAWTIVAMLAIIKAGGAWLPINPGEAADRLQFILTETRAKIALTSPSQSSITLTTGCKQFTVSRDSILALPKVSRNALSSSAGRTKSPVYIIFTSGSTGQPKGVVLPHDAVSTSCFHHGARFGYSHQTRMLQFSSYVFDASIIEIIATLIYGGCVCVPSDGDRLGDLAGAMNNMAVSSTLLTPTVARTIQADKLLTLKTLIFGGEAVKQSDYDQWEHLPLLINAYGPTEAAVTSTIGRYEKGQTKTGSIGTGVGCATWIVDQDNHNLLVPIGAVGELLVEGPILARGYLNNPEKTAAVFINDPSWLMQGSKDQKGRRGRMYKTGDLVRYNEDGSISYIGRKDTQVKIRGQRLELGEVEHQVRECIPFARQVVAEVIMPGNVKEKAMLAVFLESEGSGNNVGGVSRRVAMNGLSHVASSIDLIRVDAGIETGISQRLPRYMVPSVYFLMSNLPLMPSGKTNRRSLREVGSALTPQQLAELQGDSAGDKRQPQNETESRLRELWAQVLNIEASSIGVDDSFFHVGGDSITAMQLSSAARAFLGNISTADILQKKTIAKLAASLSSSVSSRAPTTNQLAKVESDGELFALSPIQQLYVHLEPQPERPFDQNFFLKLQSRIPFSDLVKALKVVIRRHPMLRARFARTADGKWAQRITDNIIGSLHACQMKRGKFTQGEMARAISHDRELLDIENGPIVAAMLINNDDDSQNLFISVHHLSIDLVSWRIVLQELEELLTFGSASMPPPVMTFQKWSAMQAEYAAASLSQQVSSPGDIQPTLVSYWGVDPSTNVEGETYIKNFVVDKQTSAAILGKCNEAFGTRPVELMIAALIDSFMAVFTDRTIPAVFTEGHGREPWDDAIDLSRTIGWFTTMYPVQVRSTGRPDMSDTVRQVKDFIRATPKNGWSYFTSKFASAEDANVNVANYPIELLFNFAGSYQQLERGDAFFQNMSLPEDCVPAGFQDLRRFALFDIFCQTSHGSLDMTFTYPKSSAHQDKISAWIAQYQQTLQELPSLLQNKNREWTLSDFPMAFKAYDDMVEFRERLLPELGITDPSDIEDIYPCSAMQEGILVSQGKDSANYRTVMCIEMNSTKSHGPIDIAKIEKAWGEVVQRHSLLRAILVDSMPGSSGTMQIILKNPKPGVTIAGINDAKVDASASQERSVSYGKHGLQHHLNILPVDDNRVNIDLEINHAICDGYSVYNILLRDFRLAYKNQLDSSAPVYGDFIKYVAQQSQEADRDFWMKQLDGADLCVISASTRSDQVETEAFTIDLDGIDADKVHKFCSHSEVTTATVVQTAWALVLQMYTGLSSPTFGILTSGRDIPIQAVGDIFGPLINILPCRVQLDKHKTVLDLLQGVQTEYINSMPHQTYPLMQTYRALGVGAAGLFNSAMSFQKSKKDAFTARPSDDVTMHYHDVKDQVEFDVSIGAADNGKTIDIQMIFKANTISHTQASHIANAFSNMIGSVIASPEAAPHDLDLIATPDHKQLKVWNGVTSPSVHMLIHDLIAEQVRLRPDAPAVCSWDGDLTYARLNELSSRLASHLVELGVCPEVVVPLCFEKSMWTVVAILGVLQAGGAFVLLDPGMPEVRARRICEVVEPVVAITSPSFSARFAAFIPRTVTLSWQLMRSLRAEMSDLEYDSELSMEPEMPIPANAAYIIFTSGSTGEPKGCIIEHRSYCTAALGHGSVLGMHPNMRALQFGSYNFAGAIMEMLMTMIYGGCICILSDEERGTQLIKTINRVEANWAFLTSTVLAYMTPEQVPTLKTICVGGEPVRTSQIKQWAPTTHLRQTYGSAETSAVISSAKLDARSVNTDVGRPTAGRYWITNPKNHNQLMPVGVPGEIIIEGTSIGRGYIGNPEKTAAAFIDVPAWRANFGPRNAANRFYKTGDLGCYKTDGTIELLGRKDTQIKLRGQRIEVGEIEYQARQATPEVREVAVELAVINTGRSKGAELVGFLVLEGGLDKFDDLSGRDKTHDEKMSATIHCVQARLEKVLPHFMVPSVLIPISALPLTASGKTDRRRLRIIAGDLSAQQLDDIRLLGKGEKRLPQTDGERRLQALWGDVLEVNPADIGLDDSFFRLGGDSVAAMKLVGAARKDGIALTVADIFRHPRLDSQAEAALSSVKENGVIVPFSLLNTTGMNINVSEELAVLCNTDSSLIQDAYPCTPLQEGLLSLTAKRNGNYTLQIVVELGKDVDIPALQAAWNKVIDSTSILRTRIVQHSQLGLVQVVCKENYGFAEAEGIDAYLVNDRSARMQLGQRLSRFAVVDNGKEQPRAFVWTIHHALYDGLSLPYLIDLVTDAYTHSELSPVTGFNAFVKYLVNQKDSAAEDYWKTYLGNGEFPVFPSLPASIQEPVGDVVVKHELSLTLTGGITASTLLRGALAIVMSQHAGSSDVVFGALVSGRNAPVVGIEEIVGPTIATVPIRVQVKKEQSVQEFLDLIQRQAIEMIEFEQTGLSRIAKISDDARNACKFQTLLEVQPEEDDLSMRNEIGLWRTAADQGGFSTYAITMDCLLHKDNRITIKASFDAAVIEQPKMEKIIEQMGVIAQQLASAAPGDVLQDLDLVTPSDKALMWTWNEKVPELVERCIHDLIGEQAREWPNAPAVCAWDGDLTYSELDELSTLLGCHLSNAGVGPNDIVPLFFEKSMWTVVAVMGVLKAGGAFALLDQGLPEARLRAVVEQCGAQVVCSSVKRSEFCSTLPVEVQIVGPGSEKEWKKGGGTISLDRSPSWPMYVVYTSGSTGVPKGIVITHSSFCSALKHQVPLLGFNSQSRVFDFASYSFDVAVHNVMTTLAVGGCLCVPSDIDRKENLNYALRSMRATLVDLTATVTRLLKPDELPDLKTLLLLGEAVSPTDLEDIWGRFTITNTYGPAECTPISTINSNANNPVEASGIGKGVGVLTWVVDPANHDKLVPIGVIGELLIEGPTLARGYLNNAEKTAEVFIDDPAWLLQGAPGRPGRRGRLYKTGDLVKFNEDGSLSFIGRKDTQVKIRGQRLELAEVEHHVRQCMVTSGQIVAEVIEPEGKKDKAMLTIFTSSNKNDLPQGTMISGSVSPASATATLDYLRLSGDMVSELSLRLPSYMVPAVFFRTDSIPQTPSGKTDRKTLREMGLAISTQELADLRAEGASEKRQPETNEERELQNLWAQVLNIEPETIGLDDSFFLLGGDSVGAMKLVAEARKLGIALTVADIFQYPVLVAQARINGGAVADLDEVATFSLLKTDKEIDDIRADLSELCTLEPALIEDAYPCTPLQEGLLSLTIKNDGDYVLQAVLELSPIVQLSALQAAWEQVVLSTPILRTRIAQYGAHGLVQIVCNEGLNWEYAANLEQYLADDKAIPMTLGAPLSRFALIEAGENDTGKLVWTVHHALYDGGSLPLLMNQVDTVYRAIIAGNDSPDIANSVGFNAFVRHALSKDDAEIDAYWQHYLADGEFGQFPLAELSPNDAASVTVLERNLSTASTVGGITTSTLIRGALAILISQYTASLDVVFGTIVSGRNAPVAGIETIIGPTIATVPVRMKIQKEQIIKTYLESIQEQATEMIQFEQSGLSRIAKINDDTRAACKFQTLLVVQPKDDELSESSSPLGAWKISTDQGAFTTYGLMLECLLGNNGITIRASFDTNVLPQWKLENMIDQLSVIMDGLASAKPDELIQSIDTTSLQDKLVMWDWNRRLPTSLDSCVHDLISQQVQVQPESPAICAWDGELTYAQLDDLSSRLACHLAKLGATPGSIIPICFEKSMWTIVAMMGIIKAGSAFIPLNPSDGADRRNHILTETKARIVLTSVNHKSISVLPECKTIVIARETLAVLPMANPALLMTRSKPTSTMYILFTSGSTGLPKGVVLDHRAVSTSCYAHGRRFHFNNELRIVQFSSYTFDACITEIFGALIFGGCICVPSEADRLGNLPGALTSMAVNCAILTPTVARTIPSESVPTMQSLILAGEAVASSDYVQWANLPHVHNGYGPTESAIFAVTTEYQKGVTKDDSIGSAVGGVTWVVDRWNHEKLAPLGAIGELLLEGPTLAQGYLNNPEKTADAFITSPAWLIEGAAGQTGRSGRLYKTGDLVQYNEDGSIKYLGRKDNQVKIRGQRLELGEVEHHVATAIPYANQLVAEVIHPEGEKSRALLAVFLSVSDEATLINNLQSGTSLVAGQTELVVVQPNVDSELSQRMPGYMVPSIYFQISAIPVNTSGKADRKRLREIGTSITAQQLADVQGSAQGERRQPKTTAEQQLQQLWAQVLGISTDSISADSSFFQLGGDSIGAMKLVGAARASGVNMTVADIFKHAILSEQAVVISTEVFQNEAVEPFSLLSATKSIDGLRNELSALCKLDSSAIEDAYPCTPLQEGLLSLTGKRDGRFILQAVLELSDDIDLVAFKSAWEKVFESMPILRTRIMQSHESGLVQVVCNESIEWRTATSLEAYLAEHDTSAMNLGDSLVRFALIDRLFVFTVHHALYDGWSLSMVFDAVTSAYAGKSLDQKPRFNAFVKYVSNQDADTEAFWKSYLANAEFESFPTLPASVREPSPNAVMEKFMPLTASADITMSTLLRGSLAILISQYSRSEDAIFGAVVSGRNAPVADIENIAGPTIATVPVRANVEQTQTVQSYLESIQQDATEMIQYEQTGLQRIAKLNESARAACAFQTLLVVQPQENDITEHTVLGTWKTSSAEAAFTTHALTFECFLSSQGVKIVASFDSAVIDNWVMKRMLDRFTSILEMLTKAQPGMIIKDLDATTTQEAAILRTWNKSVPEAIDTCLHDTVNSQTQLWPDSPAVCSWDGDLSYQELDMTTNTLAEHLIDLGVGPDTIVPICFEHSMWTVVAMLAIIRAGGAFLPLNPTEAADRRHHILRETKSFLALTSSTYSDVSLIPGCTAIVVNQETIDHLPRQTKAVRSRATPDNLAYVLFTSGSTGLPKGVMIPHRAISTSARHHGAVFGYTRRSRMLQFASYTFDSCIVEIFTTLIHGACICIPSTADRLSNLEDFFNSKSVNMACLTPTVARALRPARIPTLEKLVLCGEAVLPSDFEQWSYLHRLINGYGPTEAAICSVADVYNKKSSKPDSIGKATGCATWVANPADHNKLAPLGSVGELLVEGHILARGYLNMPDKTAASFIENPEWLLRDAAGRSGRLYKTGDLVRYNSDGSLSYVGRKDTQVKIRGQRLELGEVEQQVRACIPSASELIAEVIMPGGEKEKAMLAVFLSLNNATVSTSIFSTEFEISEGINMGYARPSIEAAISNLLPRYMVPSVYIQMSSIPRNTAGKTDRKQLREVGSTLSAQQLVDLQQDAAKNKRPPQSAAQRQLQGLWAQVLNITPESIGLDDSFFTLGGDSISAMKLVGAARAASISISVADIFSHPVLSQQALMLSDAQPALEVIPPEPFSLITPDLREDVIKSARSLAGKCQVSDAYPVTSFQEETINRGLEYPHQSMNYFYLDFGHDLDVERLQQSCNDLVQRYSSLRSIFLHVQTQYWQVVLQEIALGLETHQVRGSLESAFEIFCLRDSINSFKFGFVPTSFDLLESDTDGYRLVIRLSHAQYDGVSFPLIIDALLKLYQSKSLGPAVDFSVFLKHSQSQEVSSSAYWRELLDGSRPTRLPPMSVPGSPLSPNRPRKVEVEHTISLPAKLPDNITLASATSSAWAVVLSAITGQQDVVYGNLVAGRNSNINGIEQIVGPTVNIIPVRAQVNPDATPADLFASLQEQQLRVGDADSLGLDKIIRDSTKWPANFKFDSIIQHQNIDEHTEYSLSGQSIKSGYFENPNEAPAPCVYIITYPEGDNLKVKVISSSRLMTVTGAGWILDCLCRSIVALLKGQDEQLSICIDTIADGVRQ